MICRAEDEQRPLLGQRNEEVVRVGHPVGVDDHGKDLVKRDPADFLMIFTDQQEPSLAAQMEPIV